MFERRLKIFLGILLGVMGLLLVRAFHLQIVTRNQWTQAAEDFKKRPALVETTRGRLLDRKGQPIALDEACMDACVDYRAISRNEKWMRDVATARVRDAQGEDYKKASKDAKTAMIDRELEQVRADIDAMFDLLAKETGESPDAIDATCRQIELRIAMRSRMRQYRRYLAAEQAHGGDGNAPWYRRWLIEGGEGPQVDDFDEVEEEEVSVHPVVRNITPEAYLELARAAPRCPGLMLRPGTHRRYPYGAAACHVIGSLAPVTKQDMQADANLIVDPLREYQFTDFIGRSGLEALCEPTLRGTRGRVYRRIGSEDELDVSPIAGKDVRTTIDIDLQDQIQKMFAEMEVPSEKEGDTRKFKVPMHGAAVVIDVRSGAVRALASYPDFDVNRLREDYEKLEADVDNVPLFSRATLAQLEPGSTVKPIVGMGAITQGTSVPPWGVLTTRTGIECTGYLVLRGHKHVTGGRCWVASKFHKRLGGAVAHHPVPADAPHRGAYGNPDGYLCFADALERSCNVYFEIVADALRVEGLTWWYRQFGLGHETGLGIAEACGYLPGSLGRYQLSDAWFAGIGQGRIGVTPVQMANVAATIARDGVWMRPRLVEEKVALSPTTNRNNRQIPDRLELKISPEALKAAQEGMVRVVNGPAGTGDDAQMTEMLVAGKTGTAQTAPIMDIVRNEKGEPARDEEGKIVKHPRPLATADRATKWPWYRGWGADGTDRNHAWFIGYAPADKPQVAFAVVVQYGGSGGTLATGTAKKILRACIEHGVIKLPR